MPNKGCAELIRVASLSRQAGCCPFGFVKEQGCFEDGQIMPLAVEIICACLRIPSSEEQLARKC